MGKYKEREMTMKRPIKSTWYDWLINYIPELIRKNVISFKGKVVSIFKTNTSKDYGKQIEYERRKKSSTPKP